MTRRSVALFLSFALASTAQMPSSGKARGISLAAITIEVFSDFQCPACKSLHEETIKPLIMEYVDKGKVYLVHKDFPLPMHQYAREAAMLACAAGRIGKYDLVADGLFANQPSWSKDGKVQETVTRLLSPADAKKVLALAKSPEVAADVERDTQNGRDAKLNQT